MNNQAVAHAWANQTKERAKGSNFFFEGTSIYSYGHHFEIARIVKPPKGGERGIILFTTASYSVTTSGHKSDARCAVDTLRYYIYDVPRVDVNGARIGGEISRAYPNERSERHAENTAALCEAVEDAKKIALGGRVGIEYKRGRATERAQYAAGYARDFKKELRKADYNALMVYASGAGFTTADENKMNAKIERARVVDAQAEAAADIRDAEAKAEAVEKLPLWRQGGGADRIREYRLNLLPVALRLSADGTEIQTSHGAAVPVAAARELYVQLRNGYHLPENIDRFPIHGLEDFGRVIKIGCHNIPMAEADAIAAVLKW